MSFPNLQVKKSLLKETIISLYKESIALQEKFSDLVTRRVEKLYRKSWGEEKPP